MLGILDFFCLLLMSAAHFLALLALLVSVSIIIVAAPKTILNKLAGLFAGRANFKVKGL